MDTIQLYIIEQIYTELLINLYWLINITFLLGVVEIWMMFINTHSRSKFLYIIFS